MQVSATRSAGEIPCQFETLRGDSRKKRAISRDDYLGVPFCRRRACGSRCRKANLGGGQGSESLFFRPRSPSAEALLSRRDVGFSAGARTICAPRSLRGRQTPVDFPCLRTVETPPETKIVRPRVP